MSSWKPEQSFFQKQIQGNLILVNPHDIVRIPECQPRVDGTDEKLVAEYAQDMRDYDAFYADHDPPIHGWQKFPHVQCVHDPKIGYILFSGNHRLEAMLQVGYTEVEIHFFTGTRQDAIVISKRENADNGKRRTNADKAHVVKSCLLDPELKLWSDRMIANWCGVAPSTVKNNEIALSKLDSGYERPTRRKRLSNTGEIEWVETASIGNGNPEKLNQKELEMEPELQESEEPTPDPEGCRSVLENTLLLQGKLNSGNIDYRALGERYNLTKSEIKEIADEVREKADTDTEPDNLEASWKNEWLPRLKEVFIEKGYDPETIHPRIYKAVHGDQKTQIYDMSDAQLTALISQSKTVFNWKDNPENWITNRGESKIEWALRLLEDVTAAQETEKSSQVPEKQQTEAERLAIELECAHGNAENDRRRAWIAFDESGISKSVSKEDFAVAAAKQHGLYNEADYGSGENYLLGMDYAPIDKLSLKEAKEMRAFFNSVEAAIQEPADWVLALVKTEVTTPSESEVISEARTQVTEIINGLDEPKQPTKSVADVLGGDSLAFITVALREPEPTGISGKGRLNYITFDAEDDRMQPCIDISEIPEPLLVQLIAIAKEQTKKSAQA